MSDYVANVLDDAADLIERVGWCQGSLGASDGSLCALGALQAATEFHLNCALGEFTNNHYYQAKTALEAEIGWIPAWNDRQGRTKQEVLDTLRRAAKRERMYPGEIAGERL